MSKFSPANMYGISKPEERELQPVNNMESEKEREALEESAIVPPPAPRSAITTEGGWSLTYYITV